MGVRVELLLLFGQLVRHPIVGECLVEQPEVVAHLGEGEAQVDAFPPRETFIL